MNAKNKQRAKLALAELEKEMEILSKEEANACKGGGPQDIIVLFDTNAVHGFGHTAVLIGNDGCGWVYYSSNGTDENFGYSGREKGDIRSFDTLQSFNNANSNGEMGYSYNQSVRIATTPEEDAYAHIIANQKVTDGYHLFNNSCLDVPREVVNEILRRRNSEANGGNHFNIPNNYLYFLQERYSR